MYVGDPPERQTHLRERVCVCVCVCVCVQLRQHPSIDWTLVTHLYSFWEGWFEDDKAKIGDVFAASPNMKVCVGMLAAVRRGGDQQANPNRMEKGIRP